MKTIYDYYDKIACVFSGQFGLFPNDGTALRTYKTLLASGKLPPLVCSNPADFAIYRLGTFDEASGLIEGKPELIAHFIDLVEVKKDGE